MAFRHTTCFALSLLLLISHSSFLNLAASAQPGRAAAQLSTVDGHEETQELSVRLAALEKALEERRRARGVPGLSLVIVKDDKAIFTKGFGVRDIGRNLPVTPETLFAIGSATKAFTAMAAVMSADEGKLSLEDSPKKFIPYFKLRDPEADARATLRDLLCHRTGLNRTDLAMATGVLSRDELIRVAGLAKPAARFREKFLYQNVMYTAAGEAVARANKTSWEKLIKRRMLAPLGMRSTVTSFGEMKKARDFSLGYDLNSETRQTRPLKMIEDFAAAPAGAIISNARDMTQWLRLMLSGGLFDGKRLVSERGFNELVTRQIDLSPNLGYGLGWFIGQWQGHRVIDHGGNIEGYNAVVAFMPDEKLGFAMLSNVSVSELDPEIRELVWSHLIGTPTVGAVEHAPAPAGEARAVAEQATDSAKELSAKLREVLGDYENEKTGQPLEVAARGGQLMLLSQGLPARALIENGADSFSLAGLPDSYRLTVRRDAAGKIDGLLLRQASGDVSFRRLPSLAGAPPVEELMAKVVEASGGEANLRKRRSMLMLADVNYENEGVTGEVTVRAKAPNSLATEVVLYALGKKIGRIFEYFDGTNAGVEASFGTPRTKSGRELEEAKAAADFYAVLNWKTLYKSVVIKRITRVGEEDAYVVVKTPVYGNPVTEYISTKSFHVLRRDSLIPYGGTSMTLPSTERLSDYRAVDGVVLPFRIQTTNPAEGEVITIVKEVRFDAKLEDEAFQPAGAGKRAAR